jgi:hypothetical protein
MSAQPRTQRHWSGERSAVGIKPSFSQTWVSTSCRTPAAAVIRRLVAVRSQCADRSPRLFEHRRLQRSRSLPAANSANVPCGPVSAERNTRPWCVLDADRPDRDIVRRRKRKADRR